MGANLTLLVPLVLACSGIVVTGKMLYDSFDHKAKIKYDKVTKLRLERKRYDDLKYKNNNNKTRTTKGI